jgi:hypothetical protein
MQWKQVETSQVCCLFLSQAMQSSFEHAMGFSCRRLHSSTSLDTAPIVLPAKIQLNVLDFMLAGLRFVSQAVRRSLAVKFSVSGFQSFWLLVEMPQDCVLSGFQSFWLLVEMPQDCVLSGFQRFWLLVEMTQEAVREDRGTHTVLLEIEPHNLRNLISAQHRLQPPASVQSPPPLNRLSQPSMPFNRPPPSISTTIFTL